jgi:CRP-like cAMP-binding protein
MKLFGADVDKQRIERLKHIPIFRELSRKEILEVDQLLHERVYEKDEIVFEEGDAGHGVFIILSGRLRADPNHKLFQTAVLEYGPGDLVGELSLFEEGPRAATVVAVERTVALALFQAEFFSLLTRNTSIGVKVLVEISRTLCRRARQVFLQERRLPSV